MKTFQPNYTLVERVRQGIDIKEAHRFYGGHDLIGRGSRMVAFCHLPGHVEKKSRSYTVYPDQGSFYCYGCHRGGSAIDLVMHSLGVDTGTAIRTLAADFGISPLEDDGAREKAGARRLERDRQDAFKRKVDTVYALLTSTYRVINQRLKSFEDYIQFGDLETMAQTIEPVLDKLRGDREQQQAALKYVSEWIAI